MSRTDHLHLPAWTEPADKHRTSLRHRIASRLLGLPTDEEEAAIDAANAAAAVYVPGVPADDPERLAWEAELRAIGVTPARDWGYWTFKPIRPPDWRHRLRNWIDGGPLDWDEPITLSAFPWNEELECRAAEPREADDGEGWKFIPIGHPDRPEWEKRMRAQGITPAVSDVWPDLGPVEFGFTSRVRYRWTRLTDALCRRERPR